MQHTKFSPGRMLETAISLIRQLSIYKRLIISFLIIVCIPNLLIGYYSFNISSKEMENKISSSSRLALRSVELTMNEKLKLYEGLSNQVCNNAAIRSLIKECRMHQLKMETDEQEKIAYEECKRQIGSILYQISPVKDIINLQIINQYDQFVQKKSNGEKRGGRIFDLEAYVNSENYKEAVKFDGAPVWYDTSKETNVFIAEPYERTYLGNYMTLLQAITDYSHTEPLGVVVINVPTKIFLKMADLQNMYDKDEILFLSGENGIVSVLNGIYTVDMPDSSILKEIDEGQNGTIIRKISGEEYILSYNKTDIAGMSITYMAERKKILNSVYRVRDIIIEVTLICILCALILAYFVTASISLPMNKLKKAMEKVGESDLNIEYIDKQKDEIGVLGNRFNKMILRIKNLIDTLLDTELSRKNEEIKRKEAELDALQMQINPHFMYNTLDLIRWNALFIEKGEGKISKMLIEFSKLLRFNTIKTNKLVCINEEIEHAQAYVKVLKFKDELKLDVQLDITDEKIYSLKITKLTFQPLIENTIKHAIVSLDKAYIIRIIAYIEGEDVYIKITDNGIGISNEQVDMLNKGLRMGDFTGRSIGLKNVNERIKLHFGETYGLKIESREGSYTSVIIRIPCLQG